ncbi:MAG: elongation factor-1 alpha [Gammaproteobacteria bacterium]
MNKQHHWHFTSYPMSLRVLYSGTLIVLGVGYLFAMIHIFDSHAGRDGNPMLSVNDLIIAYSGSKSDTKIESALKGPMANMLPPGERNQIIAWVRSGAHEKDFASSGVEEIVGKRCLTCHDGSNPHIPTLKGYKNLSHVAEADTGMDIFTLVRVSHIHLFGITFIFFIVSTIFSHAYIRPLWIKCVIILIPFVAIIMDIGSWYLTKLYPPFAWVVMISGALMGVAFAIQWVISMYQMWFYKLPQEIQDKGGEVS